MNKLAWAQSLAILIAVSAVIAGCPPPPPTIVPDIIGLPLESAYTVLEDAGFFSGSVSEDYSDTFAAGHVISQHPQAGTTISPNTSISITVSLGPDPSNTSVTVPDLSGLTREAAELALTDLELQLGVVSEDYDETVPVNQIFSQSPEAGTVVTQGSTVDVTISLGSANPPTIDDAFTGFLDTEIPIDIAVQDLVESAIYTLEQEGADTARAELSSAVDSALEADPSNLEILWQRSFEAGPLEIELPEITVEGTKQGNTAPLECEAPIQVVWVNGMATSIDGYIDGLFALQDAILKEGPPRGLRVSGHYQSSATELYNSEFAVLCRILDNRLTQTVNEAVCGFLGGVEDYTEAHIQQALSWLDYPKLLSPASVQRDVTALRDKIIQFVDEGRTVVVVAHSQGNYFTDAALRDLGSDTWGARKDAVGVVSVGSPVIVDHNFMTRVTISQDPVARGASFPVGEFRHPWEADPGSTTTIRAHYFVSAYLAQQSTRASILGPIFLWPTAGLSGQRLLNPRATGSLRVETGEPGNTVLSPAKPSTEIRLYNDGPKDLEWISEQSSVLSVSPDPGTLRAGENVAITISYTPGAALTYPHNEVVKFINPCAEESIGTKEVPIEIILPTLGVSMPTVSLSSREISSTVEVFNAKNQHPVRWSASSSDDRVTLSHASGDATSTTVTITAADTSEAYEATVTFTNMDNSADKVEVAVQVFVPKLGVSVSVVSLTSASESETVQVTNTASEHPVRWTATPSDDRITVSPASGDANSTDVTITATDTSEKYSAKVTFTNDDDQDDKVEVAVNVDLRQPMRIVSTMSYRDIPREFVHNLNLDGTVSGDIFRPYGMHEITDYARAIGCGSPPVCGLVPNGEIVAESSSWRFDGTTLSFHHSQTQETDAGPVLSDALSIALCNASPCQNVTLTWEVSFNGTLVSNSSGELSFVGELVWFYHNTGAQIRLDDHEVIGSFQN